MKIGIMQPYFFPYIGYFSLIDYCDRFIFFDTPQYINHGWVNRNRILKGDGTPTYITVPIEARKRETPINEVKIANSEKWKEKIWGQLSVYKKKAPYYNDVLEFLHEQLDEDVVSLSELNISTIQATCKKLDMSTKFDVFSSMDLDIGTIEEPDEWALEITKAIDIDEKEKIYVNPPGGISFFDKSKYEKAGIGLEFLESSLPRYVQRTGNFEPGLSIIDVMMFCNASEISDMLKDYCIINK